MAEVRCDQTDLLVSDCAHCRKRTGPRWAALFDDTCTGCDRPITVGEEVQWSGLGGVEHARH